MDLFQFDIDERGYLKKRESSDLEYKENFHRGDETLRYIKTLVGMANNKGGKIVFGVQNSPHIPIGMNNTKFTDLDPCELDNLIRQHFEPSIEWSMDAVEFEGKTFGVLTVKEAENKPVVCCRAKNQILREGAIYYRYRGETKEIGYPELRKLLDTEREKERILWISHIQKIATIGPANVEMLDVLKGELTVNERRVIIDKDLISKIKFIREGHFVEKYGEGSPALKLVGDVEGVDLKAVQALNPNDIYVLLTSDLQKELCLNRYEIAAIIHANQIKGKAKWHMAINNGKVTVHKYTKDLLDVLKRKLKNPEFLANCVEIYGNYMKETKKTPSRRRKRKTNSKK
jgi:hypothetical protein